jgi:CHAD domain-containing protein
LAEREVKLAAEQSFALPPIDDLVGGITARTYEPEWLSTTYFDSEDLRLARWGLSLRHREGQGWTLKLPSDEKGALLVREELTFPGDLSRPPAETLNLVRAFVRRAALQPQVCLRTLRRRVELLDSSARVVAEVVDDDVSVLAEQQLTDRFRELEVEIREDTPLELLDIVVRRLREAGAGKPDPTPKYLRALGSRAAQPSEVEVEKLTRRAATSEVIRQAIASSVVRLIRHDPVMRLDIDPEGVHQARVATRRLRSDLRTFRALADTAWSRELRSELGWLGGILGEVRDGDVMLERMRERAASLSEATAASATPVIASLETERDAAHAELVEVLRGERYVDLLDRLVDAAQAPSLLPAAVRPAADTLSKMLEPPWRRLRKAVAALPDTPTDSALHDIRIKTKRCRYAAEALAPVLGKAARAFARAAANLQEVLGDHNDAVVAEEWLADWAQRSRSPRSAYAAGEMAGLERARAIMTRTSWRTAWKELLDVRLDGS